MGVTQLLLQSTLLWTPSALLRRTSPTKPPPPHGPFGGKGRCIRPYSWVGEPEQAVFTD